MIDKHKVISKISAILTDHSCHIFFFFYKCNIKTLVFFSVSRCSKLIAHPHSSMGARLTAKRLVTFKMPPPKIAVFILLLLNCFYFTSQHISEEASYQGRRKAWLLSKLKEKHSKTEKADDWTKAWFTSALLFLITGSIYLIVLLIILYLNFFFFVSSCFIFSYSVITILC